MTRREGNLNCLMFIQLQQRLVLWVIRRGEFKLYGVYTATTKVSSMGDQERGI